MKTSLKVCNTKQILIDGFNLIYKFPELEEMMSGKNLGGAMKGLLLILKEYRAASGKKIRIVFDGKKESGNDLKYEKFGGMEVYYSLDRIADLLIKEFIREDKKANQVTVVTSDKELVSYVNRFRSPVILSENFAELVNATIDPKDIKEELPPEKSENVNLSSEELSFWEKMFSKGK